MRSTWILISFLLAAFVLQLHAGPPPEFLWAKSGGSTSDEYVNSIAVDAAGNSIITGRFTGSASFLGTNLVSSGQDEIFLMKLNSNGARLWLRKAGGTNTDEAYSTALDSSGNVYIAGRFTSVATFGSTNLTSAGSHDMFLAKYDLNGNFLWARRGGGVNVDYANAVCTDPSGNVLVTGVFSSTATFGNSVLTSGGSKDAFVVKYDSAGNVLWANSFGGASDDSSFSIAADSAGNVFVSGWLIGSAAFAGNTTAALGSQDIFLAKYDSNGIAQWLRRAGGSASYDYCYSVAVDPFGNPFICGSFRSTATFGTTNLISSGSADIALAKYDTAGNLLWAQKAGSSTGDDEAYSVVVDRVGNAFVTGYFRGTASFSGTNLTSSGQHDLFIAKYGGNGILQWVIRGGGTNYDYGNSIGLDGAGNAYVAGVFFSQATLGTNTITSVGGADYFVTKLSATTVLFISAVGNQIINEDSASPLIPFTVSDVETPASNLVVVATSSNSTLLPASSMVLGGSGTNRTLAITPATNQFGTATVTLTVTNPSGSSNSSSFLLTVNPVNDAPTLNAISPVSVNEDSGTTVVSLGGITSGAGNEVQVLTVTTTSGNPSLMPNPTVSYTSPNGSGSLSFAPLANANGTATITVTVQDDGGTANGGTNISIRTFVVTVNPVNDVPTISQIADQVIAKNSSTGPLSFAIGDLETAATSLVVTGDSSNTGLIPNANIVFGGSGGNRTVTLTPAINQSGSAIITIFVNDGSTNANTSFLVTVNAVNSPPTITAITNRVTNEDTPITIPFTIGDNETAATNLIVSAGSSNTNLVAVTNPVFGGSGANRTVTILPSTNQFGTTTITVSVSDGNLSTNTSFLLTVNSVNDLPTISQIADQTILRNTSTGPLAFLIVDVETAGTNLAVTGTSSNTKLIPSANIVFGGSGTNRTVTLTPATSQIGSATITISVNDGTTSIPDSFIVTVISANTLPTITAITNRVTNEDAPITIPFTIGDNETATTNLIVSAGSSNTNLVAATNLVFGGSGANRTITILPSTNQFGTTTITVSVRDGITSANASFLLTVNPVNDAPIFAPVNTQIVNEETTLLVTNFASDEDVPVNTLTFSPVSIPTGANLTSSGLFSWAPTEAQGPFTYVVFIRATDNGTPNLSSTNSFTIIVNEVNKAPVFSPLPDVSISPGALFVVTNSAVDTDLPANTVTYSLLTSLSGAGCTAQGVFSWTPSAGQAASTNTVRIRATDNGVPSLSSTNSFVIVVYPLDAEMVRMQKPAYVPAQTKLYFIAQAGQAYRIDYTTALVTPWLELRNVAAPLAATNVVVSDGVSIANRFYRLVISEPPLQINRYSNSSQGLRFFFAVEGGRNYQVESRDSIAAGSWNILSNFTATVSTNSFSYFSPNVASQQFYRISTPSRLSEFSNVEVNPSQFSFEFNGLADTTYTVEYRSSISTNSWLVMTNLTPSNATNVSVTDRSVGDQQRFYRVRY